MRKSSLSLWGSSDTQGWRGPCFCWVGSELLPLPWPLLTPWWGALLPPGDAEISKTPLSLLRPPQERGGAVARYCWVGCNSGFPVCCPLTLHRAFGTKVLSPPWGGLLGAQCLLTALRGWKCGLPLAFAGTHGGGRGQFPWHLSKDSLSCWPALPSPSAAENRPFVCLLPVPAMFRLPASSGPSLGTSGHSLTAPLSSALRSPAGLPSSLHLSS